MKDNKKDKEKFSYFDFIKKTRTILISGPIDSKIAKKTIDSLLFLSELDPKSEIKILINSPGGEVHSGFAIYDMAKFVSSPITTIVTGLAASMGSIISLCADEKRRFATPHSQIMIHQPLLGGYVAPATDLEIQTAEILKTKELIASLYAKATKKKPAQILKDIDRDSWFDAKAALKYGLIDKIVVTLKDL